MRSLDAVVVAVALAGGCSAGGEAPVADGERVASTAAPVTVAQWFEVGPEERVRLATAWAESREGLEVLGPAPGCEGVRLRHDRSGLVLVFVPGAAGIPSFAIGETEVRNSDWKRWTGVDRVIGELGPREDGGPDFPVWTLHEADVVATLRAQGLDLPTAAEWVRACLSGSGTNWPWRGDEGQYVDYANIRPDAGFRGGATRPVASLKPNCVGAFDMLGNESEMVFNPVFADHTEIAAESHDRWEYFAVVPAGGDSGSCLGDLRACQFVDRLRDDIGDGDTFRAILR